MLPYISAVIGYKKVKFYMPYPKETQETCKTIRIRDDHEKFT
jgi:hypothetical protein